MAELVSDRESKILQIIETARAKRPKFRDSHITMSHGAGGKATTSLIEGLFAPAFASPTLDAMADSGAVSVEGVDLAMTTDSFVVKPKHWSSLPPQTAVGGSRTARHPWSSGSTSLFTWR
jgi:hypothetical protein